MSIVAVITLDKGHDSDGRSTITLEDAPFIKIAGVELLTRQVRNLLAGGATEVVLVSANRIQKIRSFVANEKRLKNIALAIHSEPPKITEEEQILNVPCNVLVGPGAVRIALANGQPLVDASLLESDEVDAYVEVLSSKRDVARAKRAIFRNVTKKTSGWVSKNINSLLSIPVSKLISEFPITPNMVTCANTLLGIASALVISRGDYLGTLGGGALFQLSAAMDRVDGEIARSKFQASDNGAWIDTAGDNITYIAFVIGLTVGTYRRTQEPLVLNIGFGLLVALLAMLATMYVYLIRAGGSGSLVAVTTSVESKLDGRYKPWIYRTLDKIRFAGKRDFFSLVGLLICALDQLTIAFTCAITVVAGTIAYFASAALRVGRMSN